MRVRRARRGGGAGGAGREGCWAPARWRPGRIAKMGAMGELIVLRHGETEWSRSGRHTGRTDVPLTPHGEASAAALAPALARIGVIAAFTSPASRAVRTAELAGLADAKPDPDLWEWDYGGYGGRATAQIHAQRPAAGPWARGG